MRAVYWLRIRDVRFVVMPNQWFLEHWSHVDGY